jgi:hypothetical protein
MAPEDGIRQASRKLISEGSATFETLERKDQSHTVRVQLDPGAVHTVSMTVSLV